jgi:NAD(P)-dependent dehydrogenase (short-subunit alcohol dehydrogenase family)
MDIRGKIVVVTGGADGIGRALALAFHRAGARRIVVTDLNLAGATETARLVGGVALSSDVAVESDIERVVAETERDIGPIDLFCSNAGIGSFKADPLNAAASPNETWSRAFDVNVMAHVYAARHLLPRMIPRGGGYFLSTVSAAGLLNQIGSAVYATTKHAAVGFAENLAISHRDQGIRVSILCPQGVETSMLRASGHGPQHLDGVLTPEQCADAALTGIAAETFCILPHPEVLGYLRNKADNYDRWIGGMAKLQRRVRDLSGST